MSIFSIFLIEFHFLVSFLDGVRHRFVVVLELLGLLELKANSTN